MIGLDDQLATLRARYPDVSVTLGADGGQRVHVPAVRLAAGWSLAVTDVWFVVPPGYPTVRPDCFYADADLKLAAGGEPASSAMQVPDGIPMRWFSWHLADWDGARDGLAQYVRFIERRLSQVR